MSHFTWSLVKNNNAFLVKRDGVAFSRESNNLLNKHSYKWSGLAHSETVGVNFNKKDGKVTNGAVLTLKNKRSGLARRPAKSQRTIVLKKDFRYIFILVTTHSIYYYNI